MKIQIDVDGVLADFMQGASKVGQSIDPTIPLVDTHTTTDWDHWEGWPKKVVSSVWEHIKAPENLFFYRLKSLISTYEWTELRRLSGPKDEIYFVTSRPGITAKWQTEGWLYDRLERQATVVVTPDKAGFAKLMKPDFSIEDNAKNAAGISQVIGAHRSMLIDRQYNRNLHPMSAQRIGSFKEFLEKVNGS